MIFYNDFQLSLIFNKYHDLTVFEIQHSHVSGKVTSALNVWVPMGRKWPFGVSLRCLGIFLYPIHYYDEAQRLDDTMITASIIAWQEGRAVQTGPFNGVTPSLWCSLSKCYPMNGHGRRIVNISAAPLALSCV